MQITITDQEDKKERLKSAIEWDEEALVQYLEKSAQMEKDNMALMKYTSEDDSKINELGLTIERLNKEAYERKSALDDVNTEVLIVQTELDRLQEEFRNAYEDRSSLINNWEKVIHQIQRRHQEISKLTDYIRKLHEEETDLKRTLKEHSELLASETSRNNQLEFTIKEKDGEASKLRNDAKLESEREEELKSQLATIRNILNNALYQKQLAENSLKQLEKQLLQRIERLSEEDSKNKDIETSIENLSKETFEADHYTKELDKMLQDEKARSLKIQSEVDNIIKDIVLYGQEITDLKLKEKLMDNQVKNCQSEVRNLYTRIIALDQVRTKQESEKYEIESELEKVQRRVKKMVGETKEEERRKLEKERSSLLATLEEKKCSLNMLTEELKLMMEKINVSIKQLEANKKLNTELNEKIKFLSFYISNSQKSLKHCITRKQDLLVEECLEKFQMKKFQKLLNNKNKSVASLQKNKVELEKMMKERTEELKHCNDLLEAEIRTEGEEGSMVKRKLYECKDKAAKLRAKYEVILDSLGITEPGESAEAELLIKAETEKRDLQSERDEMMKRVFKDDEELSAMRNTVWLINAANVEFRECLYPPGISSEDSDLLRTLETEGQSLAIDLHSRRSELRTLEQTVEDEKRELEEEQNYCRELEEVLRDRELESATVLRELEDLEVKMSRAEKAEAKLAARVRNEANQPGILEDIRIHLLREVRRTVSDLLFSAVEKSPEISDKIQELYQEANLPLPTRARSSLSLRSGSISSYRSLASTGRISRASDSFQPSVVNVGSLGELLFLQADIN
ncbi:hypothetical protein JTE90_016978 [Oedothorax gibbosus]|uniref:Coiled-coil domain-containing protein 39 n=1 Tax=Oedothorax gibbosus TaxID=931172 RepID=A0AAV6UGB7_9ARAC|nr:hypothetical protein JTE90_016978 [Oedothorax gibbosus]